MINVRFLAAKAYEASKRLALFSSDMKNEILEKIASAIDFSAPAILKANKIDVNNALKKKMPAGFIDRLILNEERISNMISEVRKVESLKDPVGEIPESRELKNGLFLKRVRVPLGVVAMIYESRPNVTVDSAVLCLKSGNAVVLKGGSDAINTNRTLVKLMRTVLKEVGFLEPSAQLQDAIQFIDSSDRAVSEEFLKLNNFIDVIIPRGGENLIKFARENSTIPVIETGASVVHTYVHEDADIKKAVEIVMNAKLRRVSICNALDVLLLHKDIAAKFLNAFVSALPKNSYKADHLEIRTDDASFDVLRRMKKTKKFDLRLKKSKESDYDTEFLDYILAIKTVKDLDSALEHIARHSLKHSEAILTENAKTAQRFLQTVDAACVYWNTSTQFSDGAQFGLGTEIGISTQKLHVRGPFALEGLTSYKWVIEGNGQIRNP